MSKFIRPFLIILVTALCTSAYASGNLDPKIVTQAKQGVVSIDNRITKSAYDGAGASYASGFVLDKNKGIIVTNAHVAGIASINDISVTFFNGKKVEAKFIYNDPLYDFAFLKVEKEKIPDEVNPLPLSQEEVKSQQEVFIVGNNEGQNFSMQTGLISNKYQISGYFPGQTYSISLNTKGGSSGSPILDYQGNVVALNFAVSDTFAKALNIKYVIDAFNYIKNDSIPPRQGTGAIVRYYFLDKAVKHSSFPPDLVSKYIEKYPDALNRVIVVETVFQDSPAFGLLIPGDIIWQVNGQDIGPELYLMDSLFNNAKGDVVITIYRNGVKKDIKLKPYNLHKNTIKRMVIFGQAIFYEVNEQIRLFTGAKLGSVFTTTIENGSIFGDLPRIYLDNSSFNGIRMINILSFSNQPVRNLNDLIKVIPMLVKEQNFTVEHTNFFFEIGYDRVPFLSRTPSFSEVEYKTYGNDPIELVFNEKTYSWDVKKISIK